MKKITVSGMIDQKGNLKVNMDLVKQFANQHRGKTAFFEITVYDNKQPSQLMFGYYFKVVVPEFQKAFFEHQGERLTLEKTDLEVRKLSPTCYEELYDEEGKKIDFVRIKEARELSHSELKDHIDHVIGLAAMNFNHYIPRPK